MLLAWSQAEEAWDEMNNEERREILGEGINTKRDFLKAFSDFLYDDVNYLDPDER